MTPSSEETLDKIFEHCNLNGNGVIRLDGFLYCVNEIMGNTLVSIFLIAVHGVLYLILELKGEIIKKVENTCKDHMNLSFLGDGRSWFVQL